MAAQKEQTMGEVGVTLGPSRARVRVRRSGAIGGPHWGYASRHVASEAKGAREHEGRNYHLVGIGGAGMRALAELLLRRGAEVSGSDREESEVLGRLRRLGATIYIGHASEHVQHDHEAVIYSPAVGAENPERQEAGRLGCPQWTYPEMLGRLMERRRGVCIAGTHGKSTTTAMVGYVLAAAGLDPTVVVGAEVPQLGGPSRAGDGDLLVVESCEFNRGFLNFAPEAAAILNVEEDHLDCYSGLEEIVGAFHEFAGRVRPGGVVVALGTSRAVRDAVKAVPARVETFALEPEATWWAADLREDQGRYRFRVFYEGEFFGEFRLQVAGRHNVLNALAATALAHWAGVARPMIREGLEEFRGIGRRFEVKGTWRGVTLVDDYGHHPTEIRATLRAARQFFGKRRIWCVFQPHQGRRTRFLLDEFARSFQDADRVIVPDIYYARETEAERRQINSARLVQEIVTVGGNAYYVPSLAEVVRYLEERLEPGDVLVTMGAGDIGKVCDDFAQRVQGHRQAG